MATYPAQHHLSPSLKTPTTPNNGGGNGVEESWHSGLGGPTDLNVPGGSTSNNGAPSTPSAPSNEIWNSSRSQTPSATQGGPQQSGSQQGAATTPATGGAATETGGAGETTTNPGTVLHSQDSIPSPGLNSSVYTPSQQPANTTAAQ